jgi:hypothetical protein
MYFVFLNLYVLIHLAVPGFSDHPLAWVLRRNTPFGANDEFRHCD